MSLTIIYERTGQTISHVPPARASNPTYLIENIDPDAATRLIDSGAATNPSWTITTSAAAGADQRNQQRLSTANTSTVAIGDWCSVVAPDGARESFRVKKISTNSYIESETALAGEYPSGSTVQGIEFTATVPDSLAANETILTGRQELRVVWTYEIDGRVHKVPCPIEFVRHTSAVDALVGEAMSYIRDVYPDMPGRLAEGADLERIVSRMAERVANDLRRNEREPELFMTGPQGLDLVVARVLLLGAQQGYAPGGTTPDRRWREECQAAYDALLAVIVAEEPGDGVVLLDHATDTATDIPLDPLIYVQTVDTATLQGLNKLRSL